MAKKRSRRDTTAISNRRLPGSSLLYGSPGTNYVTYLKTPLQLYEDRRLWHPEGAFAPAKSFSRARHRLTLQTYTPAPRSLNRDRFAHLRSFNRQTKARISFAQPDRVLICVRRNIRKQVLHAFRKTGKVGQKRPKFTFYSRISCRR